MVHVGFNFVLSHLKGIENLIPVGVIGFMDGGKGVVIATKLVKDAVLSLEGVVGDDLVVTNMRDVLHKFSGDMFFENFLM